MQPGFGAPDPPLNLVMLASYIIKKRAIAKNDVTIISAAFDDPLPILRKDNYDIVGMSVLTPFVDFARNLAIQIKKEFNTTIIIGGYHISGLPESLAKPYDMGVLGEGEETLCELLKLYKQEKTFRPSRLKSVRGIVYFDRKGQQVITPARPLINLKQFPKTLWDLIPEERIVRYNTLLIENQPKTVVMSSVYTARGCPYRCVFCAHQVLWGNQTGLRFYETRKVGEEISYLVRRHHVNCIQILDDTFAISKSRLKELIQVLKKRGLLGGVKFFNVFIRANLIDEEFVTLLKEFGAATVFIGMESGHQDTLNYLKRGSLKITDIKRAVKLFNKVKIHISGSFILFSPDETKKTVRGTLSLARWFISNPYAYTLSFHVAIPFPGTVMWDDAVRRGVIDMQAIDWSQFMLFDMRNYERRMHIFFHPSLTKKQIDHIFHESDAILNTLHDRFRKREDWIAVNKQTNLLSRLFIIQLSFSRRIEHVLKNPFYILSKIIHHPDTIVFSFRNLFDGLYIFTNLKQQHVDSHAIENTRLSKEVS